MRVTRAQRAMLEKIKQFGVLAYGGDGHWFFHGRSERVRGTTARVLIVRGWLAVRPKRKFWLTEYELTAAGRAVLLETRCMKP